MTEREKFKIAESKREIFARDNWECQVDGCQERATQIAHRIAQTSTNLRIYGEEIVHHGYNLVAVCSLEHNALFNIGNNPGAAELLVSLILHDPDIYEFNNIPDHLSASRITAFLSE